MGTLAIAMVGVGLSMFSYFAIDTLAAMRPKKRVRKDARLSESALSLSRAIGKRLHGPGLRGMIYHQAERLTRLADYPGGVGAAELVGLTILGAGGGAFFAFAIALALVPDWATCALAVGLIPGGALPWFWVYDAAKQRLAELRSSFHYCVDLLSICVEAGLDFTEGMKIIVRDCAAIACGKLFADVLHEIRMGVPRDEAIRQLETRTELPEFILLANAISVSDETGGNLSSALRELARDARNRMYIRAEEYIAKAPVKMIFPVVLFLFPVVVVIILAPIGFSLLKTAREMGLDF